MGVCRMCGCLTLGGSYCNECWQKLKENDPEWVNADGEGERDRETGQY